MDKFFNALGATLLIVVWLCIMVVMGVTDLLQLDALVDNEITWIGYALVTALCVVAHFIAKKLHIDGDLDDLDFD